jgi:hypothetical protein
MRSDSGLDDKTWDVIPEVILSQKCHINIEYKNTRISEHVCT